MKNLLYLACVGAGAALVATAAPGAATPAGSERADRTAREARPSAAARTCRRGLKHAVIAGAHRCLRTGQPCARRFDRAYHRYGFHCHGKRLTRRTGRSAPPPPTPTPPPPALPAAGTVVASIRVGADPGFVVVAEGSVWVKNHGAQPVATVSRIDPATNAVTATIPIGAGAFGYLAAGDGSVWATNNDANTVSRIDARTSSVVATVAVGENPQGIAVGFGSAWVANHRAGTISRIDTGTNTVTATISAEALCCSPQAVAVAHGSVWVGMPDKNQVVRLNPATNTVSAVIAVEGAGGRFAATEDSLWLGTAAFSMARIDPATNGAERIDVRAPAFGAAAGLGSIWITELGRGLIRLDPQARRVVGALAIPGAAFPAVGFGAVWVSSDATDAVLRVEPAP